MFVDELDNHVAKRFGCAGVNLNPFFIYKKGKLSKSSLVALLNYINPGVI